MIRLATSADVPRIVELGSLSLVGGAYEGLIADNTEQTYKLALQIINGGGKILVAEEKNSDGIDYIIGVFGMLVVAHPFDGTLVADELMWFVMPEVRKGGDGIKLLWEAERIALELGCKHFQVSAPSAQIGAIYKRFGFREIETKYLKELK